MGEEGPGEKGGHIMKSRDDPEVKENVCSANTEPHLVAASANTHDVHPAIVYRFHYKPLLAIALIIPMERRTGYCEPGICWRLIIKVVTNIRRIRLNRN